MICQYFKFRTMLSASTEDYHGRELLLPNWIAAVGLISFVGRV